MSTKNQTDEALHNLHAAIGERLRYVRRHHPEGPFSLDKLAERSGVAKRTLGGTEAGTVNMTIDTLYKIASCLGIDRVAYFIDPQVFAEVNSELDTVTTLRDRGVRSVALRSDVLGTSATGTTDPTLAKLLQTILQSANEAVRQLPHDDTGRNS